MIPYSKVVPFWVGHDDLSFQTEQFLRLHDLDRGKLKQENNLYVALQFLEQGPQNLFVSEYLEIVNYPYYLYFLCFPLFHFYHGILA